MTENFFFYLLVIAGVTYLVRMLPMVLVNVPYAVLGVMTVPAIFYSTEFLASAIVGFIVACILAYLEKSLLTVAASACGAVLVTEVIIKYLIL